MGIRFPEDIDLIGFDCVEVCAMMKPPLPVVSQPESSIGQLTGEYMIQRLEGYDEEARITRLSCQLLQP